MLAAPCSADLPEIVSTCGTLHCSGAKGEPSISGGRSGISASRSSSEDVVSGGGIWDSVAGDTYVHLTSDVIWRVSTLWGGGLKKPGGKCQFLSRPRRAPWRGLIYTFPATCLSLLHLYPLLSCAGLESVLERIPPQLLCICPSKVTIRQAVTAVFCILSWLVITRA